jgi:hypothetical protein
MDPTIHHTLPQPGALAAQVGKPQASRLRRNKFRTASRSWIPWHSLVHDRWREVVGPGRGVVVGPEAGIDLGDDDLPIRRPELVDFLGK